MSRIDYFERGLEFYNSNKYKEAAEHFLLSMVKVHSNVAAVWLIRIWAHTKELYTRT